MVRRRHSSRSTGDTTRPPASSRWLRISPFYDPQGVSDPRARSAPVRRHRPQPPPQPVHRQGLPGDARHRETGAAGAAYTATNAGAIAWDLIATSQALSGGTGGSPMAPAPVAAPHRAQDHRPRQTDPRVDQRAGPPRQRLRVGRSTPTAALNRWYPTRGANNGVLLDYGGIVARVRRQLADTFANSVSPTGWRRG